MYDCQIEESSSGSFLDKEGSEYALDVDRGTPSEFILFEVHEFRNLFEKVKSWIYFIDFFPQPENQEKYTVSAL